MSDDKPRGYVTDGHLGGYFEGGDPATQYPDMWAWLVEVYGVQSVLDVGCGEGQALEAFASHGADVLGIDGMPQPDDRIIQMDFQQPVGWMDADPRLQRPYDLVWSCEFVEHVEEQFLPRILDTFSLGTTVLMTHADPGQGGWHHVNCRTDDYWVGAMAARSYELDVQLTRDTRALAAANLDPHNHYVRSGLAFTRREA